MRRHEKASTAGSTKRQAKGLGRFFRGADATRGASSRVQGSDAPKAGQLALALCVGLLASLALAASPAAASQGHYLKEVFGSAAQPSFISAGDVAIDQSTGDLIVMEAGEPTFQIPARISRFNPDGTPDDFSALGGNRIDGKEGPDATPQEGLSFGSQSESQIAVDNSGTATDGDIYVTQSSPNLINVFSETGAYLGQLTESSGGPFSEACGVAVDSSGALYVGDYSGGIHKFTQPGIPHNPLANADNTANFNTTSEPCTLAAGAGLTAGYLFVAQRGGPVSKIDSSTGELKYEVASGSHVTVAVDPGTGHVYAASSKALEEFDASGASPTSLSATKVFEFIHGLDVRGSSGEIYLVGEQTSFAQFRAEIYDDPIATLPDSTTTDATANTGTHATLNGTVDPDGVELDQCRFEWTQTNKSASSFIAFDHTVPCAETPAEIGSGTSPVAVHADVSNLTPQGTRYVFRLAAKNPTTTFVPSTTNVGFETPDTVVTEVPSGIADTSATLNGSVNPDGVAITACSFEWGPTSAYGNTAPCVPNPAGIGSGTSPVPVSAEITGLHPGTTYHYRLKAANADGPIAPADEMTVQSAGPFIADSWAEDVIVTEATLKAEINPEGSPTTYHFDYGTTPSYGSQTPELSVGSDSSTHTLARFLEGLQPGTTYHYRVLATNSAGTNEGPDHTIRTFAPFTTETECPDQANRYGAGANLPDCRAYELVSPLDKNNGDIASLEDADSVAAYGLASRTQSAPSGDRITYSSYRAFADAQSVPWSSQYIAQRSSDGWQTHSINQPGGNPLVNGVSAIRAQYQFFSEDLCQAWMRSFFESPQLEGVAGFLDLNFYRREDRLCGPERFQALAPIVTPPGGVFVPYIEGASADSSHAVFDTNQKLVPEGQEGFYQLYESAKPGTPPRLVCVLPSGEAWDGPCTAGGGAVGPRQGIRTGAISEDGERIFWTNNVGSTEGKIYVRIGGTETVPVSEAGEAITGATNSYFWGAAANGSRAVYTTGNFSQSHLFAFDVDDEATEPIATGVYGVLGISKDARRVYFLSSDVLPGSGQNERGEEAIAGEPNLYEADAGAGASTFIATLSSEDAPSLDTFGYEGNSPIARYPGSHFARVTPDGLHLVFASKASLTGYDNKSLTNQESEPLNLLAYVYDAQSGKLICASCIPSGARGRTEIGDRQPAGVLSWTPIPPYETSLQPSRLLSDDGTRLFFESANPLEPHDTNGKVDVYEWEKQGAGRCDAGDSSFIPSAEGCIGLISSGTSDFDSLFAEATPSGNDVFISTNSSLVAQDYGLRDIYDARVNGGFPLPPEAPECIGDACQSVPASPSVKTPASAGFKGEGNLKHKAKQRHCRARSRHAGKGQKHKAKRKAAKACKRAKRGAGR